MPQRQYIDNRWKLDANNRGGNGIDWKLDANNRGGNGIDSEKEQFAYRIWREDFERNQEREDGKKSEIRDAWTEVYQLIGFDNVFQGVWFQGVTQLASQRDCHFSIIPIILSILVSLATIVGVYSKISKVQGLQESLLGYRSLSKSLQSFISACENSGVGFDFDKIEDAAERSNIVLKNEFDQALVKSKRKHFILLVSLIIASVLFAWLIYLIMCGKYV